MSAAPPSPPAAAGAETPAADAVPSTSHATPVVVSMDMGYGHLRAALPLARAFGTEVVEADHPPLAGPDEARAWAAVRWFHESGSRVSQIPLLGRPMRRLFEAVTAIPRLHPARDLSAADMGARMLDWMVSRGLGQGLAEHLRRTGSPLLSTFYAPAVAADRLGCEDVFCLVTDSDIARVWAPLAPAHSRLRYLTPSRRAQRRLESYGVPAERIRVTGFPLPQELLGGPDLDRLRRDVAARLVRLDPRGRFASTHGHELSRSLPEPPAGAAGNPVTVAFAVGGAGAQADLAGRYLSGMADLVRQGRLRLVLVAGIRPEVARRFEALLARAGLEAGATSGVEILLEPDFEHYYDAFNARLAHTDLLWTKPSELTFYAALGLPLLLAPPVGVHERYNRRWATEAGAALLPRDPAAVGHWLPEWLDDGTLAAAAWSGFRRLPRRGLYRIVEAVGPG